MTDAMDITSPEPSRKRSLPDDDQTSVSKSESQVPTPPLTASPANQDTIRRASPAPSSSALSSAASAAGDQPADPNAPPKKRVKLTPAEKEERRLKKEESDKVKAEAKLKREVEKQKKDEERRRKNEEKEAKLREKELKKAKEEEEKLKKAKVGFVCPFQSLDCILTPPRRNPKSRPFSRCLPRRSLQQPLQKSRLLLSDRKALHRNLPNPPMFP